VFPPPSPAAATLASFVAFAAEDLRFIAAAIGIDVISSGLEEEVCELSKVLTNHWLWDESQKAATSPGDAKAWAVAVERWAREGLTLLGGGNDPNGWKTSASNAYRSLSTAVPEQDDDTGARPPPGAPLYSLAMALDRKSCEVNDMEFVRALLQRIPPSLEVVRQLACGFPEPPSPRKKHHGARIVLFNNLRKLFEHLHPGRRFTVSTDAHTDPARRYGPALEWCRHIFELTCDRVKGGTNPSPSGRQAPSIWEDKAALEFLFRELVAWATRPDALAERILSTRRRNCVGKSL